MSQTNENAVVTAIPEDERKKVVDRTAEIRAKIETLEVSDKETAETAKTLEKECVSLEKYLDGVRDSIVRPMNEMVKDVNSKAKELVAPITEAKELVRAKQVEYANRLEAERLAKERAILEAVAKINATADEVDLDILSDTLGDEPDARIESAVVSRRSFFEERARMKRMEEERAKENARLAEVAKEQGEERARMERENARIRMAQMEAEAEAQRLREENAKREAQEKALEEAAKREKEAAASAPKWLRMVARFEVTDEAAVPRQYLSVDEAKVREALKNGVREIPGFRIWAEAKIQ